MIIKNNKIGFPQRSNQCFLEFSFSRQNAADLYVYIQSVYTRAHIFKPTDYYIMHVHTSQGKCHVFSIFFFLEIESKRVFAYLMRYTHIQVYRNLYDRIMTTFPFSAIAEFRQHAAGPLEN